MTEYEPYGVRYFLRHADPEGASELRRREVPLRDGSLLGKGRSADVDEFQLGALLLYRTLVLRRSPYASRPPTPYRLLWRGRFYEVWQRPEVDGPGVVEHLSLGHARDPQGRPSCQELRTLARRAGSRGRLAAATVSPAITEPISSADQALGWRPSAAAPGATIATSSGPLSFSLAVRRGGRYEIWLGGGFRGTLTVSVDGRPVGEDRHELSHDFPYVSMGTVSLAPGVHDVVLNYEGADLSPGSGGAPLAMGPVVITQVPLRHEVRNSESARYRELCGHRFDWIEAVKR